jgi:hypothetical protein
VKSDSATLRERMGRGRILFFAAVAFVAHLLPCFSTEAQISPEQGQAGPEPRKAVVGLAPVSDARTLYAWVTDRCEDEFIPDAPARAISRSDGQIALIASHRENWALVGSGFSTLRPSCRSLLRSSDDAGSEAGNLWIEATFTSDGQQVMALVSQDLTGRTRRAGCSRREFPGDCWLNKIVAARSTDMGQTFSLLEPDRRIIATLGDSYPQDSRTRFGVFTTSNIVRGSDGAQYMIAYTEGEGVQEAANCLFRTDDPFTPERWRAWDGSAFNVDMRSESIRRPCRTLDRTALPNEVRSLTFVPRRGVWLAVFAARVRTPGDEAAVPGFYFSQSADLVRWQPPQRVMRAPTRPRLDDPDVVMSYPSLLDPASASRNFDTLDGDEPVLLFTVHHLKDGRGTMNRDLRYVRLRVE